MKLILPSLNLLLIMYLAGRYSLRLSAARKKLYWLALALKFAAGVGLGWLYFNHYGTGDTISFWQDGLELSHELMNRPTEDLLFLWDESLVPDLQQQFSHQGPRSLYFIKICGLLALVSGGYYWIMGAWLSLAAFGASWLLFTRFSRLFPDMVTGSALVFLLIPSVVFWSSGLIKESLGLAALYLMIATLLSVVRREVIGSRELVIFLLALWVGWNLKYYWLGIFLPVAVPVAIVALLVQWKQRLARFDLSLWFVLFLGCTALATNIHPNFYVSRFLEVVCQSNLEFSRLSEPPRLVQYFNLEPELTSLLMNAPAALIAGLFRPFIWEAYHVLSRVASVENLLLLLLTIQALPSIRTVIKSEHRVLVCAGFFYALLLIIFLALSTPNFGTLSRYRIAALPVWVLLCLVPSTPLGRWLAARRWFG